MASPAHIGPGNNPETITTPVNFNGHEISVESAAEGQTFDITGYLRDPGGFHGDHRVHDLVYLGPALAELIGTYQDDGFFADRDSLPDKGIVILADHVDAAAELVSSVDVLAEMLADDQRRYDDRGFCEEYLLLAQAGFGLLREHMPKPVPEQPQPMPISLERAGLVTTRLAQGVEPDAKIPGEIRVVTKRAHPRGGRHEDLMVTVKWRDLGNVAMISGKEVEVADFVNPASWASTAAMLVSARHRGGVPSRIDHSSFMATKQGIVLSKRILEQEMGIEPHYFTVGVSENLTTDYYLEHPGVGDAGQVLRHFLPNWYEQ